MKKKEYKKNKICLEDLIITTSHGRILDAYYEDNGEITSIFSGKKTCATEDSNIFVGRYDVGDVVFYRGSSLLYEMNALNDIAKITSNLYRRFAYDCSDNWLRMQNKRKCRDFARKCYFTSKESQDSNNRLVDEKHNNSYSFTSEDIKRAGQIIELAHSEDRFLEENDNTPTSGNI